MNADQDIFWGRCTVKTPEEIAASPFRYDSDGPQPHWRKDGTCSHCGGMRPSLALELIRNGAVVEPTDKNYKIYVEGGCSPGGKCYLNHFSESQAVEFVRLDMEKKMNLAHPGHFYRGLCFGIYEDAIHKMMMELKALQQA